MDVESHLTLDQAIDTVIAIGYLRPEWAHPRYRSFIEAEIKLGRKPHQNEEWPPELIQDVIQHCGSDGLGLVAQQYGVANVGADLGLDPDAPEDPAGEAWAGRPAKSGKHFNDGSRQAPYGGLGICHLDSGSLRDCYEEWGYPSANRDYWRDPANHFNAVLKTEPKTRNRWLDWADSLVDGEAALAFGRWSIRYWLKEYWEPAWEHSEGVGSGTWIERVKAATMLARIANSAKGWAKQWRGLTGETLAAKYVEAKREKRGDSSAKRTERQAAYVKRVWALVEWARMKRVEESIT